MMDYAFSVFFWGLPLLIVAGFGWWLFGRVRNVWGRACIRGFLVSMVLVPTPYGHAGSMPAILAVLWPPMGTFDWAALAALAGGWLVAFGFIVRVERAGVRRRR